MPTEGTTYPRAEATAPPAGAELAARQEEAEGLAERFQALADASRLKVLHLLHTRGDLCACELQATLGVSASNLSFHLQVLRHAGFVKSRRVGKWIVYRLAPGMPNDHLSGFAALFGGSEGCCSPEPAEEAPCCACGGDDEETDE